jgi:quinol-cytochrome oxidoreductase complex cytochrome b subunit
VVVAQRGRSGGWRGRHVAVAIAAVVAAGLASYTTRLVRWDQLALRAVTVGTSIDGYWAAAFHHGVRFVLVDGNEVSQRAYATALVVHLVAPVVATLGLAHLLLRHVRRRNRTDG